MPELPEVETIARKLSDPLKNRSILFVDLFWPRSLQASTEQEFKKAVTGQICQKVGRRGKWIILFLEEGAIYFHLRMSGRLFLSEGYDKAHTRLRLIFNGFLPLYFNDPRKFGRFFYSSETEPLKLGIEPLSSEWTISFFTQQLKKTKKTIKTFLLDQKQIAGIGNIYADEALWESSLHPFRICFSLKREEIQCLHQSIQKILRCAIEHEGTSLGHGKANFFHPNQTQGTHQYLLNVYQKKAEHCSRCTHPIKRVIHAQRSTYFCPHCQKKLQEVCL